MYWIRYLRNVDVRGDVRESALIIVFAFNVLSTQLRFDLLGISPRSHQLV